MTNVRVGEKRSLQVRKVSFLNHLSNTMVEGQNMGQVTASKIKKIMLGNWPYNILSAGK